MQILMAVVLWIALLYFATLATVLVVSVLILRQKIRKYQENGRFGY